MILRLLNPIMPDTPPSQITRILLTLLLIALAGLSHLRLADDYSAGYINQTLQNSLITFGVARGLNGVISVAQGTELALEPGGVGVNLAVGEILDPINDLVERFSWIMLTSSTSLAIQAVLLNLGGATLITLFVIGLSALVITLLWLPGLGNPTVRKAITRALILFCFVRFTVVTIALVNHQLSVHFLDPEIAISTTVLQQITEQIEEIQKQETIATAAPAEGFTERIKQLVSGVTDSLNASRKLAHYQAIAANAVDHIVRLAALFIVQTVLMPLLFLWGLIRLLRYLLAIS